MTAQIVIMNKEAIALASDSAITMTRAKDKKIFTTASKLFALSRHYPIGIMISGSASFMGIPWETIIKIYRNKKGKESFDNLNQHAIDFIEFLDRRNTLFPATLQKKYLISKIYSYFDFIKRKINKEVSSEIYKKGKILDEDIKKIVSRIIKEQYGLCEKADNIPSVKKSFNKKIIDKYNKIIKKAIKEVFENLPITRSHSSQLKKIVGNIFSKFPKDFPIGDVSEIVIAGFGKKDTFPALNSYIIEGKVEKKLKFKETKNVKIALENTATIIPFAQREMVDIFMQGIDPFYLRVVRNYLLWLSQKYSEMIVDNIKKYTDKEKNKLKKRLIDIGNEVMVKNLMNKLLKLRK